MKLEFPKILAEKTKDEIIVWIEVSMPNISASNHLTRVTIRMLDQSGCWMAWYSDENTIGIWMADNMHLKIMNPVFQSYWDTDILDTFNPLSTVWMTDSDAWFLKCTGHLNWGQIVCYSDHHSNSRLKSVLMIMSIWGSDFFRLSKNQKSLLFRSP